MALAHTVLALLAQQPKSGYDVSKCFDEGLSCYWRASQQQVYRELSKMEAQGWVDFEKVPQEGKPDKKVYRITSEGWKELNRWYAEPTERTQIREDLLVKVMIGHKMPRDLLRKELHHRLEMHQARLEMYQEKQAGHLSMVKPPAEMQFKYLTLKRGIAYEESWLTWCNDVLEFLDQYEAESH